MGNERFAEKMKKLAETLGAKPKSATFKLEDGLTKWRFLPYKNDEDGDPVYFKIFRVHYMGKNSPQIYVNCPSSFGEECPICAWANKFRYSEDENRASLAYKFYANNRIMVNAVQITVDDDDKPHTSREPVQLTIVKTIFDEIQDHIVNMGMIDMLDINKGCTIGIKKTNLSADKRFVKYKLIVDQTSKPVFNNPKLIEKVLAKVVNFDEIVQPTSEEDARKALEAAKHDMEYRAEAMRDWKSRKSKKSED